MSSRSRALFVAPLLVVVALVAWASSPGKSGAAAVEASSAADRTSAWKEAVAGRVYRFPRDHGAHPEHRIEWWYYTGNLEDDAGGEWGYQLTFFRVGITRDTFGGSIWAPRDLYMGHAAVSAIGAGEYLHAERIARAGPGWAGALEETGRVWIRDWSVNVSESGVHRLRARAESFALELDLEESGPPIVHGERGLSVKGRDPGNASHYYSLVGMRTRGTVAARGQSRRVRGESWMDHEFGTSFLEAGTAGWDWFSLSLDDGSRLMIFVIREEGSEAAYFASGTLILPDGRQETLGAEDIVARPGRRWRSPGSGGNYPVEWTLEVARAGLRLAVRSAMDAQEFRAAGGTLSYWEGAVRVEGTRAERSVKGVGYLEMTGYSGAGMSRYLGGASSR